MLAARRKELLDKLAQACISAGGKALVVPTDITKHSDVKKLVNTTLTQFGKIDVLINNAGLMTISPLKLSKVDEWEKMVDINIRAVLDN